MSEKLTNNTAVITGGASGIGRAVAEQLGRQGANIVIADIQEKESETTVDGLQKKGVDAELVQCDVTNEEEADHLASAAVDAFGSIEILVNSAGISGTGHFTDIDLNSFRQTIEVNLVGLFNVCRAVVPMMVKENYGRIVNVASMAGTNISYVGDADYTASKWGVIGLTKHMAWDLGDFGITANALCPGPTVTSMLDEEIESEEDERATDQIPIGRLSRPEDQANAVAFLVSESGKYVNGTTLEVDGGLYLSTRRDA